MGDKQQHVVEGLKNLGKRVGMGDKQQHLVYRDLKETFTSLPPPPPTATCRRDCGVGVSK